MTRQKVLFGALLILCLAPACRREAAAPGPPGSAQITSTPAGATVFIDNQFVGLTPYAVRDLSPGTHSVKLEKMGCRRYFGTLTIGASPARLAADLEPERSSEIRIASLPSDAALFVNGRYRTRTPAVLAGLPAGTYEIRLHRDNCDPWLRTVDLRTGEKLTLNAELESPAETFLRGAVANKPTEANNYTELARHYILRNKYDQAMAAYKMGLDRRDKSMESRLYTEIARAYGGQFKSAENEADLDALRTKIINLFAQTGNALTFYTNVQRSGSQLRLQLSPEAEKACLEKIQQLEEQIAAKLDDVPSRLALAKLYLDRADMKHAQEHLKMVSLVTEKNWMTDAEKRQEAAQLAKGLVKVDGRWVTPKEAERIALAKLPAAEKARLAALDQPQRAAREAAERLAREQAQRLAQEKKRQAEDLARKQAAENAKRDADELAKKQVADKAKGFFSSPKAFTPNDREWVADTFQSETGWQPETWADQASLKVVPFNTGKALNINYAGGRLSKACVSRQIPAPVDISSRNKLVIEVVNNTKTLAALSVIITSDQDYESQPQFIRPGGKQRLIFPIRGSNFKCKRDNWNKYAFAIAQPNNVTRLGLMLNTPANLIVKDIRLTK